MPQIAVSARRGDPEETSADTRVIGLFEDESLPEGPLRALSESGEARGKPRSIAVAHSEEGRRVIVVGLGKREEFDSEKARVTAAVAAGRARELSARALSWEGPPGSGVAGALVEGTLLALYKFDRFKSSSSEDEDSAGAVESLEVASASVDLSEAVERASVMATAQNAARDLQNLPSNVATPSFLASRAEELAGSHSALSFEALGPDEIASREMGGFLGGRAGADPR